MRLDSYIAETHSVSRSQAKEWIVSGAVTVSGAVQTKPAFQVDSEDAIELQASVEEKPRPSIAPESLPLDLLYEDDDLLVLNKQIHITTHPAESVPSGTLVNALVGYGAPLAPAGGDLRPGIVHRLDKDTEGLMVVAKTDAALKTLQEQFQNRTVEKVYRALIKGHLNEDTVIAEYPLKSVPSKKKMQCCSPNDPDGKPSKTIFTTQSKTTTKSIIEAELITGRMHQIRVHLAELGHPILGDPLYGKASKNYAEGQVLQAFRLGFTHPSSGKRLRFELPPSSRFY